MMNTIDKTNLVNRSRFEKDPIINMGKEKGNTIKSGELAVKQAEKTGDTLHEAKDKAQMTATAAMSIVHISLLKEVLDRGPHIPYYYVSVVLVSIALFLQINVGLIAIVIANLRKNADKHREHSCEDLIANICGCKIKSKGQVKKENRIRKFSRVKEGDIDLGNLAFLNEHKSLEGRETHYDEEEGSRLGMCCCTSRIYPDYEYDILDRYDCWCAKNAGTHIGAVRHREKLERLKASIKATKADIKLLAAEKKTPESEQEMRTLEEWLNKLKEDKEVALSALLDKKILDMQGKILFKYTDAIRKKRVLKLVSFWQNAINYMLYVVCIINAFIAGFGLGTPADNPMVDQSNLGHDSYGTLNATRVGITRI